MTKAERHDRVKAILSGRPVAAARRSLPCVHEGAVLEFCSSCNDEGRHVRDCDLHDRCTRSFVSPRVRSCDRCGDYAVSPEAACGRTVPWDRKAPLRYDASNLYPGLPGFRFNGGPWRDSLGLGFVWRSGWYGSNLHACRLSDGYLPVGPVSELAVSHPAAGYGREDPQPFLYGGAPHVAFVGVQGSRGRVTRTNVLFARLRPDFTVEGLWAPRAPGVPADRWEKNWSFFDHDGDLYAVYSIAPHRVLRVRGNSAAWAFRTENPLPWAGGERRGGAPPVKVGDEYWVFFHDRVDRRGSRPLYRTGLYTFEAKPPFRPVRHLPVPVMSADPSTNPGNYCDCVFPRGAVRDGPGWVVGYGVHDRWNEFAAFDHDDLERRLRAP